MTGSAEHLIWTADDAREWVAVPTADDDKYSRGVLGVITGSHDYPGAAVLGVEAAARTGVGMVRYTGPKAVGAVVLARRPEIVTQAGRVQAWLIGSGMTAGRRTFVLGGEMHQALVQGLPTVIDAGALDLTPDATGPTVITPHAGELAAMLSPRNTEGTLEHIRADASTWAARAADEFGVTVLLKGSTTHVAAPGSPTYAVTDAPGWLATAGTGDVLAGILGALLATNTERIAEDPARALPALAATASFLHSRSAELASGGGPITALDVAEHVPAAIARLLRG
ncbi:MULTISPECIES: ADP-dependent NAD(P)H-hydrate dehydratase [unclassified Leifsonia]|uniref:ADP-dependent NAD(P)H-hydrate dehydratase n=1 Tax=unclassified Leifsonia TaxID=2663824 RepID=UPI0006F2CB4E|nr:MULTISPECIES: ADP/ATP-dependent (S)-NAD(P)H-hydrate dehydratase [unclassified Leifsonia]KQX06462.1 NAD(P)H-hydrate dehydratase [Leifsonia sp. Root1293]KRA10745.1 NAD(P)H-hydrate dehydratase [Leifsonia sp. Root60]